ncbi:hypothetical protein [Jiangella gansuensis]|uniref:hypothetical protein n=1 Tax=Jiangella gansuensis TaxID=281473 RepID=UPI00047A99F4|nr:hypothetical protein [Jiangella gansuensis]
MTESPLAGLLTALEKLPPAPGLTYRGLAAGAAPPDGTLVTQGLTATSRDPRVATENFTAAGVLAVAGHHGRDLGFFAQNPAEAEVVFLPGTVFRPVRAVTLDDGQPVVFVEELRPDAAEPAPPAGLPASTDELVSRVRDEVDAAQRRPAVTVTNPGKFAGDLR